MDPLPLSKATNSNLLQILKKCNDVSFVRAVQTCQRLYDIADRTKPRVFTTAYLAVFVYYDKSQRKIMFDVPYVDKERQNGPVLRPRKRRPAWENSDREIEDDQFWYNIRSKQYPWKDILEEPPEGQLLFIFSERTCAFHKKMTAQELGELLQFFRFKTLAIDIEDYYTCQKQIRADEEVLKVVPYIQADLLFMDSANSEDLFYRIIQAVQENCHIRQLRTLGRRNHSKYGSLDKLPFNWHTMEKMQIKCRQEDTVFFYKDLITKWESGQTNMKYLKLLVEDAADDFRGTFQTGPVFLKTEAYADQDALHYLHSVANNRWAITLFCNYAYIFFFYDISDCDGCDCQTEFCFKKLMEVIGSRTEYRDAVDWGPILDRWNSRKVKTLEALGGMIEKLVDKYNPRAHGCCAAKVARRSAPCTC